MVVWWYALHRLGFNSLLGLTSPLCGGCMLSSTAVSSHSPKSSMFNSTRDFKMFLGVSVRVEGKIMDGLYQEMKDK